MLCNVFLKDRHCEERSDEAISGHQTEIATASLTPRNDESLLTEKAFEYVKQKYSSSLKTVVEHSKTTMLILLSQRLIYLGKSVKVLCLIPIRDKS